MLCSSNTFSTTGLKQKIKEDGYSCRGGTCCTVVLASLVSGVYSEERICPLGSKLFLFMVDPVSRRGLCTGKEKLLQKLSPFEKLVANLLSGSIPSSYVIQKQLSSYILNLERRIMICMNFYFIYVEFIIA